jgi:hypothetical protein
MLLGLGGGSRIEKINSENLEGGLATLFAFVCEAKEVYWGGRWEW